MPSDSPRDAKSKKKSTKPKTIRKRTFERSKDWGWMFSQRLVEALARRLRMPRLEVERLLDVVGEEGRELLLSGHPVGLPGCPVMYAKRYAKPRKFYLQPGNRRGLVHDLACVRVYTSRPFRTAMQEKVLDRGDIRDQYDAERKRVGGLTDKAFRPRKHQLAKGRNT